jgi:hypothetical protein
VPPPLHAGLRDEEMKRLIHAHTDIDGASNSRRFSRAIANADLTEIEAGRLLILHVAREISARLNTPVEGIRAEASRDPFIAVRQAVELVVADCERLATRYEGNAHDSRRQEIAATLLAAADVAAEAKVATAILAASFEFDAVASACADVAATHLARIRARIETLGLDAAATETDLDEGARIRLAKQASHDLDAIAPSELRRIERLAGNWYLLTASTPRMGSRKQGSNLVPPLNTRDAVNLRRAGAAAAAAFAHLRDAPGFLGLLRETAMVERHREAAATGATVFKGSPLANLNQRIREALRGDAPTLPVLVLRNTEGGVEGRFESGERMGIAILDDHPARLSHQYPHAVRVVPLAPGRSDLPSIEEARAVGVGLSFRTLEDALACIEIGDPDTVEMFFDGDYAVVDRLDEPAPAADRTGPAPR